MTMRWFKRHPERIDPIALSEQADKSLQNTRDKQEHVNALVGWLERRKNQNGFGEDFELTLVPKGAK